MAGGQTAARAKPGLADFLDFVTSSFLSLPHFVTSSFLADNWLRITAM